MLSLAINFVTSNTVQKGARMKLEGLKIRITRVVDRDDLKEALFEPDGILTLFLRPVGSRKHTRPVHVRIKTASDVGDVEKKDIFRITGRSCDCEVSRVHLKAFELPPGIIFEGLIYVKPDGVSIGSDDKKSYIKIIDIAEGIK